MDTATITKIARVLDLCAPLNAITALVATYEIASGISGTPFELLIVAMAEAEARRIEATGHPVDYATVIERTRRRMRSSPPWSAEIWDAGFSEAYEATAAAWRAWRGARET